MMHDRRSGDSERDRRGQTGQRGNFYPSRRPSRWDTIRTVIKEENHENKLPLRFDSIIERPEYSDGQKGFYRLMTTITVGNYHIRLPTKNLLTIIHWLEEKRHDLLDAMDEVRELNIEHKRKEQVNYREKKQQRSRRVPVSKQQYPLLDDEKLDRRLPRSGSGPNKDS